MAKHRKDRPQAPLLPRNRIAELRKAKGLSQQKLAEMTGSHWVTISKLERGRMGLTQDWMEKIAPVLGVNSTELLTPDQPVTDILVCGEVSEDGYTYVAEPEDKRAYTTPLPSSLLTDPSAFWVFVEGTALYPIFRPGDFLGFEWMEDFVLEAIGKICYVQLEESSPKGVIGYLFPGMKYGEWTIAWMGMPTHQNIQIYNIAVLQIAVFASQFGPVNDALELMSKHGVPTRLGPEMQKVVEEKIGQQRERVRKARAGKPKKIV